MAKTTFTSKMTQAKAGLDLVTDLVTFVANRSTADGTIRKPRDEEEDKVPDKNNMHGSVNCRTGDFRYSEVDSVGV